MNRLKVLLSNFLVLTMAFAFTCVTVLAEVNPDVPADTGLIDSASDTLENTPGEMDPISPDPIPDVPTAPECAEDVPEGPLPPKAMEHYVGAAEAPVGVPEASEAEAEVAAAQQGEFYQNGKWYYRNADGSLFTGWGVLNDGRNVFYGADGAMVFGEQKIGNEWWYFDNQTGNRSLGLTNLPDGRTVYYDYSRGILLGEEAQVGDQHYFFSANNGNRSYGMQALADGRICFYDQLEDGSSQKVLGEERSDNGHWYFFNTNDGSRHNGWGILPDGRNVFYDGDNGMVIGQEKQIGNEWWYFSAQNGQRALGLTDLPDGRVVYYDYNHGILLGDEAQVGEDWYYFSANNGNKSFGMQTLPDGRICFYDELSDGRSHKALGEERSDNGRWYFFNSGDGSRHNGWGILPDGRNVFYDGDNGMVIGQEKQIGNEWWYFSEQNGQRALQLTTLPDGRVVYYDYFKGMLFGWQTIDGREYHFNEHNGSLEQISDPNDDAPGARMITVYDIGTKGNVTGRVSDILARIVASEVGGSNNADMYRAQAIASYSWLMYSYTHYGESHVPHVFLGNANATIQSAVDSVEGQFLSYNDAVALAMYGASTAGVTNNAATYFGSNQYPYLTTVSDPYGVTMANHTSTWNVEQMRAAIQKMTGSAPTGDASTWVHLDGVGGYITGATVSGQQVSASKFFDNLYGLYSPYVTAFNYNSSNQTWNATTSGNGHGIGMSHTGAISYAKSGWNYQQILGHYYPGTSYGYGRIGSKA